MNCHCHQCCQNCFRDSTDCYRCRWTERRLDQAMHRPHRIHYDQCFVSRNLHTLQRFTLHTLQLYTLHTLQHFTHSLKTHNLNRPSTIQHNTVGTCCMLITTNYPLAGILQLKLQCGPMPNVMVVRTQVAPSVQCRKVWLTLTTRCCAVTLPRRETRWNLHGCLKLPDGSQPLVGRSSPYRGDIWRTYRCSTSFFSDCRYVP